RFNRLREVRRNGAALEAFEYNGNNVIQATLRGQRDLASGGRTLQDGERTLVYGPDGAVSEVRAASGTRTLKHNVNGRLVEVTEPDGSVIRYEYDAFGRRTAKIVGGVRTEYLWEVWELAAEVRDDDVQSIYASLDLRPLVQWTGGRILTPILDHS